MENSQTGRIWQRGASKGRKGSTNRRMMNESAEGDFGENVDQDAMSAAL